VGSKLAELVVHKVVTGFYGLRKVSNTD
jgi:hypothetical protein